MYNFITNYETIVIYVMAKTLTEMPDLTTCKQVVTYMNI